MLITRTLYVGMQNERAMIFGSVAPIVAGGSGAGGLAGISVGGAGGTGGGKLSSELETLTAALVPNPAATMTATTTAKKPTRRFQFNVSFRVRGRSTCTNNADDLNEQQQPHNVMKKSNSQCRQLQQQSMQEQQKQYSEQSQPCYGK